MLDKAALATQRTLGLLPSPVRYTSPTKNMTACSDTWILHLLETKRTLPVPSPYPRHRTFVTQLVPRRISRRRMYPLLQFRRRRRGIRAVEKKRIIRAICVWIQRDLYATSHYSCGTGACSERPCAHRIGRHGILQMQICLHGHLQCEKNTQNLISDPPFTLLNLPREDVSEIP